MSIKCLPNDFLRLRDDGFIGESDVVNTHDGFFVICKSVADILAEKGIVDFPDPDGTRLACNSFFDDWFLYAVDGEDGHTYGLLKMREQEFDSTDGAFADGDTPGVTVSFISFDCGVLLECLSEPADENRQRLDLEINRVVARRGERHHNDLKKYFANPKSEGAPLIADIYADRIATLSQGEFVNTPEHYRVVAKKRSARLPRFIESLNREAGYTVCDHEKIYLKDKNALTECERAAILATHTGNTSKRAFTFELRLHARFLTRLARVKIPLLGRSAYDSAIRADMTIEDKELAFLARLTKR